MRKLRRAICGVLFLAITGSAANGLAQEVMDPLAPSPGGVETSLRSDVKIQAIEGASTLTIAREGWGTTEIEVGAPVEAGSRIVLKPGVKATLVYADGSKIVLQSGAEFTPDPVAKGPVSGTLHSGKLKGTVTPKPPQDPASEEKPRIRFMIRTRSAVMGVRGTVFEMIEDTAASQTRVETLEGVVEVAKDESVLLTQGGTQVPAGQFVTATPDGISEPQTATPAANPAVPPAAPVPAPAPAAEAPASPSSGAALGAPSAMSTASGWLPKPHLLALEGGLVFSQDPDDVADSNRNGPGRTLPFVSWKPGLALPKLGFIRIRGHIGFGKHDAFTLRELGGFVTVHVLDFAFVEAGGGKQTWLGRGIEASTFSANAGLLFSGGIFDRILVGRTAFRAPQGTVDQYRVGLGLAF